MKKLATLNAILATHTFENRQHATITMLPVMPTASREF
jgi:hypothetical protein